MTLAAFQVFWNSKVNWNQISTKKSQLKTMKTNLNNDNKYDANFMK